METTPAHASCLVHAPAKLNLCLELLGKRPDGFHELRTLMASLTLCDTVRVSKAPSEDNISIRSLRGAADDVPTDESNLVIRALVALREAAGFEFGAVVDMVKRIPSRAGLGGGSSDAAAAIVAGARAWGLDWSAERLIKIGARIGSDVPFFVSRLLPGGRPLALATGRGERVSPLDGPSGIPVVIVKPPEGLSTHAVYQATEPRDYSLGENHCALVSEAIRAGSKNQLGQAMQNGLQAAAARVAPWIASICAGFDRASCLGHQLSGSGSAYFGLARSVREARRLAERLRALRLGETYVTTIA